jgi:uncharacterized protein
VFAVPDEPTTTDEAEALSLVILGPVTPHVGRGAGKSVATEAVTDTLMRRGSGQRTSRNTLLFVAADETQLATAREAMRRALAWESIGGDPRHDKRVDKRRQDQMTQAQLADARDKFKNNGEGAARSVRAAWSHVLFPVESTEAGKPFDLDHLALTARDRASVPAAVYDKASAKGDGIIKETLGGETLSTRLTELWPADRPHFAGGRDRRMVRDLCLPTEIARSGSAGDRDPRRARQARSEIRLFRGVRPGVGQVHRPPQAKKRRSARCRKPPSWYGRRSR